MEVCRGRHIVEGCRGYSKPNLVVEVCRGVTQCRGRVSWTRCRERVSWGGIVENRIVEVCREVCRGDQCREGVSWVT